MYPVHCRFEKPQKHTRVQLGIRLLASIVIGMFGLSLVLVYAAAYVALPAFAAARIARHGPDRYLAEDAPRVVRALAWFGAVYAWFTLVVDELPERAPEERVAITVDQPGHPSPVSALVRPLTGLLAALVLVATSIVGAFVWIVSLAAIIVDERVPDGAHEFLAGLMRMALRLLAYQAAVVDAYPPASFADTPPVPPATHLPGVA